MPLKSVKVDVKVVNFTAEVTITQNFVNCEAAPIECLYHFPVEEEAAVTDFTAQLEGRTIRTIVKKKVEARDDYNKAVARHQTQHRFLQPAWDHWPVTILLGIYSL